MEKETLYKFFDGKASREEKEAVRIWLESSPENEQELQKAIRGLTKDKTILMIAHRLSTVRTANQIIVLENGRIVQRGNHEELMREDGLYRRFVGMRSRAIGWTLKGGKADG